MKNNLSCNTVQDLLPIYLDGLASKETTEYVENHLKECKLCQNEYKKLCELTEKNQEISSKETATIKSLQKKIKTTLITIIILGVFLVSIDMYSLFTEDTYHIVRVVDILSVLPIYIFIDFVPLFAIFVALIWRKTSTKTQKKFWPNVWVSFLIICMVGKGIFSIRNFVALLMKQSIGRF
ncbi:zf-HC2 domain-containing protein [Clostridium sp. DL1XJH146]